MQMTVYLDQVWLLNGVVDYLLLSVCGTLTASLRRRWRLLLAAAMGGIYAVVCLLPGWEFLGNLLWRILAGLALCLMAYGPGQGFLRRSLVLGQPITILERGQTRPAVALDLEEDFSLRVREEDGTVRCLSSGEVSVRPHSR